ncbi:hypothetical protein NECAME_11501 [Necator americanus]|uniref:Uncharacterized protein n=1 Tax=Necator americanus TaxID=51031 RepID=W2T4Y2_NECAM|nr:hypothetical protein NECAME_11501 [Necator americanus]ETN76649.1 hypothetical protein NECAME_11501 [Necator americanus]
MNLAKNRQPIWRRHVFPASPAVSVDPFELPPSLTPALKRVKSRTKLAPKTQAVPDCSSTVVPSLFLRTSPRKKPPTENNPYPVSLPPKKPRLAFLTTSTSDFRSPRKPVTIEPDFQAPRASPKKKLQPSATLSDLRRSPSASTNRRRRASLSCSHSKEPLAKQLRKRSSSLELRDIETNEIAIHRKRRVNYVKQVNVLDMVTTLTEIFPSQNTEQAVTLSTESVSSNDPEVKITPPPLGAADRDSQEDTNCNHDTLKDDELIETNLSAGSEHVQGEAETTNSFVKSCPLETKLISSKTEEAANSNNRGELVEPERGQPVVVMNTMEVESGISFASIEKTAKDGSDERENDNNDDQIACSCSIEAGSSTSSCRVECVSDGATQEATANEIKISRPVVS